MYIKPPVMHNYKLQNVPQVCLDWAELFLLTVTI